MIQKIQFTTGNCKVEAFLLPLNKMPGTHKMIHNSKTITFTAPLRSNISLRAYLIMGIVLLGKLGAVSTEN